MNQMQPFVPPTPEDLLKRWDAQQTAYIKHRQLRFEIVADVVKRLTGPSPRVLDLACGPGSLTRTIVTVLPKAKVTAVDKDPLLLAIARDVFAANMNIGVSEIDLDDPDWAKGPQEPFDAIVSSTALHWLAPDVLSRLYFQLADLIAPGGVFLNADHLLYDDVAQPALRKLAREDDQANQDLAFGSGTDTWDAWWAAAESRPAYAEAAERRKKIWAGNVPTPKVTLGYHLETLRSAGFRETETVWQYLDDYVICAIR